MQRQLTEIVHELDATTAHARTLAGSVPDDQWLRRPDPNRWSIGENVVHLTLTTKQFLPRIRQGISDAQDKGWHSSGPFRRDLMGWFLCRVIEPPYRMMKVKTAPAFVPQADVPKETAMASFLAAQEELKRVIADADGLDLHRIRIQSPFDSRVKYNLYSTLRIIAAHQRRHLWAAEQIRPTLARPLAAGA